MLSQKDNDVWSTASRLRFIVVGGGIAGLAAAHRLAREVKKLNVPSEVLLFEGSPRVGGCISTYNLDDTILELGPDSFITEKPAGIELCKELGIENRLIQTDKKNRRTFVAHNQKLYPLPEGFLMMAPTKMLPMLASPLFSWDAKLRMMQEIFIAPAAPDVDESLAQFVNRRLGREVLDRVVQPLVGGIYTSDPDKLSIKAALPRMVQLEQQYGSLIKGLSATAGKQNGDESGARYGMFVSFDEGMNVLVNQLVSSLPQGTIQTHSLVSKVRRVKDSKAWEVEFYDGKKMEADGVVIATSSYHASDIVYELDALLSHNLRKIPHASSAVLNLIYKRSDIPHALDGFGFVVPRTEKRTIIACSFSSVKWPGRAPADKVLMRVFLGGALQPDVFDLTDEQIECLMWEDLHTYLGIRSVPVLSVISRFPRSMPQYNLGHLSMLKEIDESVAKLPGLAMAGNAYTGIGIPDCIASGQRAADAVLQAVASRATP